MSFHLDNALEDISKLPSPDSVKAFLAEKVKEFDFSVFGFKPHHEDEPEAVAAEAAADEPVDPAEPAAPAADSGADAVPAASA